jgi:hypothetical protein
MQTSGNEKSDKATEIQLLCRTFNNSQLRFEDWIIGVPYFVGSIELIHVQCF